MSTTDLTLNEMAESLTGYEELAIAEQFKTDVALLMQNAPTTGIRALAFVHLSRAEGTSIPAAKTQAMAMPAREVMAYFADEPDDLDPDQPDSSVGNGD